MKKLSDYTGDAAILLWADLLEPISKILADEKVRKVVASGESKMAIAQEILKAHPKDAAKILQRIDPEPLNGLNIILRLIAVLSDIGQNEEIKSFFGFAERANKEGESIGSPMVNTEE